MQVLLIERDDAMRESLSLILEETGFRLHHAWPIEAGVAYLRGAAEAHAVIMSNLTHDNRVLLAFFQQVSADPDLSFAHRYIALTTAPAALSTEALRILKALHATIVHKPFELDDLLTALRD